MKSLNFLRSLSRLFIVVFSLVLLAMVPLTSSAQAAQARTQKQPGKMIPQCDLCCPFYSGRLTLNPTSGFSFSVNSEGTLITATGTGFAPGYPASLTWPGYGIVVNNDPVDSSGNLQPVSFNVPLNQLPGSYQVAASGCYDSTAYATLQVLACPAMFVNPYYVQMGHLVTIHGCGFYHNALVTITGGDGAHGQVYADSFGAFTFSWYAPIHKAKYCYGVIATDSYQHTARAGFCDAP